MRYPTRAYQPDRASSRHAFHTPASRRPITRPDQAADPHHCIDLDTVSSRALAPAPLAGQCPRRSVGVQGAYGVATRWPDGHPGPRHRDEQSGQDKGTGKVTEGRNPRAHLTTGSSISARQAGHGVRGGKAMIATLRHRLIRVPPASSDTPLS
jgi:hypothetical protein